MRKLMPVLLGALLMCSMAFSADAPATKETKDMAKKVDNKMTTTSVPMDNVTKMSADGNRTAMCGCGKIFDVTDKSPSMKSGSTTMYCCSQECHDHAMKMSKEESEKSMSDWMNNYCKMDMASNSMMKDGKMTATCGCGKQFEVTDKSPMMWENGMKMYCCSEACHEHMMGMTMNDRMDMEKKMISGSTTPAKKDTPKEAQH